MSTEKRKHFPFLLAPGRKSPVTDAKSPETSKPSPVTSCAPVTAQSATTDDFPLSPCLPVLPHKWLDPDLTDAERISSNWQLPADIAALPPEKRPGYRLFVKDTPRHLVIRERLTAQELVVKAKSAEANNDFNGAWMLPYKVCRLCEQGCGSVNGYSHCCHDIIMTGDNSFPYPANELVFTDMLEPRGRKSRFKNVYWSAKSKKYRAGVMIKGVRVLLGQYSSEFAAACAIDNFHYWGWVEGKFETTPQLNFPNHYNKTIQGLSLPGASTYTVNALARLNKVDK